MAETARVTGLTAGKKEAAVVSRLNWLGTGPPVLIASPLGTVPIHSAGYIRCVITVASPFC